MEPYKPCPLFEEGFTGPCQNCNQRTECIMLVALNKIQTIEAKLGTNLSPQTSK